jgi:pimeloyl-ACP methyl ester carboxylesterase
MRYGLLTLALAMVAPAQQVALYEYDRSVPFEYQEEAVTKDAQMEVAGAGFRSPRGGKVNLLVVRPVGRGPFAAIVYQHGGVQSMLTYLAEAEVLARAGAVSLILEAPGGGPGQREPVADKGAEMREHFIDLTVCYRRAIDYLETLSVVDPKRIAFVGHSYGAVSGSALVAADKRIRTFVLVGGVARWTRHVGETDISDWIDWRKGMSPEELPRTLAEFRPVDPDQFVGAPEHGAILVQCGNFDFINVAACRDLYGAMSSPKEVRWYDTDHSFADVEATFDRMQWLQKELRLKPVRPLLDQLWSNPRKRPQALNVK